MLRTFINAYKNIQSGQLLLDDSHRKSKCCHLSLYPIRSRDLDHRLSGSTTARAGSGPSTPVSLASIAAAASTSARIS